jgi:hypothetical protein
VSTDATPPVTVHAFRQDVDGVSASVGFMRRPEGLQPLTRMVSPLQLTALVLALYITYAWLPSSLPFLSEAPAPVSVAAIAMPAVLCLYALWCVTAPLRVLQDCRINTHRVAVGPLEVPTTDIKMVTRKGRWVHVRLTDGTQVTLGKTAVLADAEWLFLAVEEAQAQAVGEGNSSDVPAGLQKLRKDHRQEA